MLTWTPVGGFHCLQGHWGLGAESQLKSLLPVFMVLEVLCGLEKTGRLPFERAGELKALTMPAIGLKLMCIPLNYVA